MDEGGDPSSFILPFLFGKHIPNPIRVASFLLKLKRFNFRLCLGIGAGIIPDILDRSIFEEAIRIKSDDAIEMAKRLALEDGLLVGISTGANVCAAIEVGRPLNRHPKILLLLQRIGLIRPTFTCDTAMVKCLDFS